MPRYLVQINCYVDFQEKFKNNSMFAEVLDKFNLLGVNDVIIITSIPRCLLSIHGLLGFRR